MGWSNSGEVHNGTLLIIDSERQLIIMLDTHATSKLKSEAAKEFGDVFEDLMMA